MSPRTDTTPTGPRRSLTDALPGIGLALGGGAGMAIGVAVAGGPGVAVGLVVGAGLGIVVGAALRAARRA